MLRRYDTISVGWIQTYVSGFISKYSRNNHQADFCRSMQHDSKEKNDDLASIFHSCQYFIPAKKNAVTWQYEFFLPQNLILQVTTNVEGWCNVTLRAFYGVQKYMESVSSILSCSLVHCSSSRASLSSLSSGTSSPNSTLLGMYISSTPCTPFATQLVSVGA